MLATELDAPSASGGVTGTIQYMAPEQFDGHPGDQRADIFAFGCVLYELLTGRKAFDGVNFLNVVAAIKSSEPPPNERIRGAHPMLDHILRRCFEKDPDRRWQSIGDVTGELRWVRENPAAPPAPAVPPPATRRRVPVVALLALGAAFGAVCSARCAPGRSPPASLRCASRFPPRRPTNLRWRCRPTGRRSPSSPIASGRRCSGCVRSTAPRAGCSQGPKAPAIRSGRPMGARSASSPTTS